MFTKETKMKLLKTTTLALSVMLSLTACGKADKAAETTSAASTLAHTTIEQASIVVENVKMIGGLNEEQTTCVDKIDFSPMEGKIQKILEESLTEDELKQINDFNNSEAVQAVVAYTRDQRTLAQGGTVENPAPQPTEEQLKALDDFEKSEVGQKYESVYGSTEEGSLSKQMEGFFGEELKKCKVDIEL